MKLTNSLPAVFRVLLYFKLMWRLYRANTNSTLLKDNATEYITKHLLYCPSHLEHLVNEHMWHSTARSATSYSNRPFIHNPAGAPPKGATSTHDLRLPRYCSEITYSDRTEARKSTRFQVMIKRKQTSKLKR